VLPFIQVLPIDLWCLFGFGGLRWPCLRGYCRLRAWLHATATPPMAVATGGGHACTGVLIDLVDALRD